MILTFIVGVLIFSIGTWTCYKITDMWPKSQLEELFQFVIFTTMLALTALLERLWPLPRLQ